MIGMSQLPLLPPFHITSPHVPPEPSIYRWLRRFIGPWHKIINIEAEEIVYSRVKSGPNFPAVIAVFRYHATKTYRPGGSELTQTNRHRVHERFLTVLLVQVRNAH